MAHGVGVASNSCFGVLPCSGPNPRLDYFDKTFVHLPSVAYSPTFLGFHGVHYLHQYDRWKVSTQIRRIHPYNPHPRFFCHSSAISDFGVTSGSFRSFQKLPKHRQLAYARSLVHDRTHWICLYVYRYVAHTVCIQIQRHI